MEESTKFLIDCYGYPPAQSMTECWQRLWAQRTGKKGRPPKLSNIPLATPLLQRDSTYECWWFRATWDQNLVHNLVLLK